MTLATIFLILSLIIAVLAAANFPSRINLLAAAFACFIASMLAGGIALS